MTIATDFESATSSGWTDTDVPIPTRKSNRSQGDMIISYNFITFVPVVVEPAVGQLSAKKSKRSKGKNKKHNNYYIMTIATDFESATSSGGIETDVPKPKTRKSNRSKGDMIYSYRVLTFVPACSC